MEAILQMVSKGSKVKTDSSECYKYLPQFGYRHEVISEAIGVKEQHSSLCQQEVRLFRKWLIETYHGAIREDYLSDYMEEYMFRINHPKTRDEGLLFYRLLKNAVAVAPVSYRDITW